MTGADAGTRLGDSVSNSRGNERASGLLARIERVIEARI